MVGATHIEQRQLQAAARVRTTQTEGGLVDHRTAVDHELLSLRSVVTVMDGITIVRGASTARRPMVLHVRDDVPALGLHITLHGTAQPRLAGHAGDGARPGEWLLFGGDSYEAVLEGGIANRALRINFTRAYLDAVARRHPTIYEGAVGDIVSGRAAGVRRVQPMPLGPLADLVADVSGSETYGDVRALFLESVALGLLARAVSGRRIEQQPLGARDRERMLEARVHLLGNLRSPPTLPALARLVGTNEFRLKRDFKLLFGEPVHAFVLRRRLEQARMLLADRDRSIKQIAAEVGYAHVSHFSAAFRKRFGSPPTALRR